MNKDFILGNKQLASRRKYLALPSVSHFIRLTVRAVVMATLAWNEKSEISAYGLSNYNINPIPFRFALGGRYQWSTYVHVTYTHRQTHTLSHWYWLNFHRRFLLRLSAFVLCAVPVRRYFHFLSTCSMSVETYAHRTPTHIQLAKQVFQLMCGS